MGALYGSEAENQVERPIIVGLGLVSTLTVPSLPISP
jgi:hypothetical protein